MSQRSMKFCLCKIKIHLNCAGGVGGLMKGRAGPFQNQSSKPKEDREGWAQVAQTAMVTLPSPYGTEL